MATRLIRLSNGSSFRVIWTREQLQSNGSRYLLETFHDFSGSREALEFAGSRPEMDVASDVSDVSNAMRLAGI